MRTNLNNTVEKNQPPILSGVTVKIEGEELDRIKQFFGLSGMKKAYLDRYPNIKRSSIYNALRTSKFSLDLINTMREFMAACAGQVEDFLKPTGHGTDD